MINVQQNEKAYTIFVTIPFKKTKFSETPYKRDFQEFAEEVFKAIALAIEDRMKACASNLIVMINTLHILENLEEENIHSSDVIDEYRELK